MEKAAISHAHRSLALTALSVRGSVQGNEWSIFIIWVERSPVMERSVPVMHGPPPGRPRDAQLWITLIQKRL
jgi:hypothetical protein